MNEQKDTTQEFQKALKRLMEEEYLPGRYRLTEEDGVP